MHTLTLVAAAALLAGCTSLDLARSDNLLTAPPDKVIEHRSTQPVPVAVAWRNTLTKARECWQQSSGIVFTASSSIEADPFDPAVGEARIAVRMERVVQAVVVLRPAGADATDVLARVPDLAGTAKFFTEYDLPNIGDWAAGKPVACGYRFIL
jgi:uncharacterized lipoprotein YmbA